MLIELVEQASTTLETTYPDLASSLTGYKSDEMTNDAKIGALRLYIREFKLLLKARLDKCYEIWIYLLKVLLPDNVVEDFERSKCLKILDA